MNNNEEKGIGKLGLIALIISSSIGAGAFGITSDLARVASGGPALLAWLIVGLGVFFFVISLLNLSRKRQDLNAGLFVFAQEGFGRLAGFISGWSYWLAAGIGNIALATMMMSALGNFFPIFGNGQNIASILGATVLANRAKRRADAYQATYIGLLSLLLIYVFVSILPYGVMSQSKLMQGGQPAIAAILRHVVGEWGAIVINIGLIISVAGAWLSWTLLPAEVATLMTQNKLLPKYWGELNDHGAPTISLVIAGIMQTIFVWSMLFTTQAYTFAYTLCTSAYILCYLLVALYQIQYSWQQREYLQLFIGVMASIFQAGAIILAGLHYLWLMTIAFVPGFYFFYQACKQEQQPMTKHEKLSILVIAIFALCALVALGLGKV